MSRFKDWLGRRLFPGVGDEPPAHADEPVEEFLDPYTAGEEYRRRYLEHTTDEAAVAREAERRAVAGEVDDPFGKPVPPRPVTPGSRSLTGGERPPMTHYRPTHWPRTAWPTWRGDDQ